MENLNVFFKTLNIIFYALLTGMVLFGGVTLYLIQTGELIDDPELYDLFIILIPVFSVVGVISGMVIGNIFLAKAAAKEMAADKMKGFMLSFTLRSGLIEMPVLIAMWATISTNEYVFLGFSGLLILIFVYFKPNPEKVKKSLNLS